MLVYVVVGWELTWLIGKVVMWDGFTVCSVFRLGSDDLDFRLSKRLYHVDHTRKPSHTLIEGSEMEHR
jgi:hypothetical protein